MLVAPWGPVIGLSLLAVGARIPGVAILATGVVAAAVPFVVRATGRVTLGANLLLLGILQSLFVSSFLLGGGGTPPTAWMALVPVIGVATGGPRTGALWTAAVIGAATLLAVLHPWVETPYLAGAWVLVGWVSCAGLYVTVGMLVQANASLYAEQVRRTREAEAAHRAANEAKSSFLANMSHDLRTPLNAIIGYTEMLTEDAVALGEEGMVDDLGRVSRSGRHLLALVNDILDLSKIEADRLEVRAEAFDVARLAEAVADDLDVLAKARGNTIRREIAAASAQADPARVRQCLHNLLSNAVKFTDNDDIVLRVIAEAQQVRVIVEDRGRGMDDDELVRAFQPFVQSRHGDSAGTLGGTGLGLPITQRLVELMGGRLEAESTPGVGSRFEMWLPGAPSE